MGRAFLLPAAGFRHLVAEHFKSITVGIGHGAWSMGCDWIVKTLCAMRRAPCQQLYSNQTPWTSTR